MTEDGYQRFGLRIPEELSPAHREAIELELGRLHQAFTADDDGLVLGQLKCLVESVSKVVLDLNGTPAEGGSAFEAVVRQAHDLLARQRGHELTNVSPIGNVANQARKIVGSMGEMRNAYGAGHGRARAPQIAPEMLALAVDGSLMWVRWALRRAAYFAIGRPEVLIRDLIGDADGSSAVFRSGELTSRLEAAGLANLEERHARAVGVAVGQRAAQRTFVVATDGVEPAIREADAWPAAYRVGLAHGLLFDPWGQTTLDAANVLISIKVLRELPDVEGQLESLISALHTSAIPHPLPGDDVSLAEVKRMLGELGGPSDPSNGLWIELGNLLFPHSAPEG